MATIRSIRFRIVAAFTAATLLLVSSQAFLIYQQQRVANTLSLVTEGYVPLSRVVDLLERDRGRVENDVGRLLREERRPGTGEASTALLYTQQLQENLTVGRQHIRTMQSKLAPSAEDQAALFTALSKLDTIEGLFEEFRMDSADAVSLAEAGDTEGAGVIESDLIETGSQMSDEILKLKRLVESRIEFLTRATEEAQVRATAAAALMSGLALVVAFVLIGAVLFALRPIGRLTTQVQRLAAGEYGGRVEVRGADEIGILAAEFNAMVRVLEVRDRTLVERAAELNRLSRYLGSVLDSMADALLVVEGERVTLCNPAAEKVWGARQGQAPPDPVARLIADPGRHETNAPNGRRHEVRVAPFGEGGSVVVSADITEQILAQERLARSERLALVGQMLAQITHEVRNPLNALSLNAELLADELGDLDPEHKTESWDLLATVSKEIDRLTDVTGHYLQLARRPPTHFETEDLAVLVRELQRLLEAELEQQKVGLHVLIEPMAPQEIDGNQLRQALLNVLRNAVEAGARSLRLRVRHQGDQVRIELDDDGPGMTQEQAERALDPFYSTKASGTGLGLAITKQILDDHGGTVAVTSSPGQGARVVLSFPYRPAEPSEPPHAADHPGRR